MAEGGRSTGRITATGSVPALVAALAAGATIAEAAHTAGMSERTARRRLADPDVRSQVTSTRADAFAATTSALTEAGRATVAGLREIAENADAADSVRVRAYGLLLSESRAHREQHDVEARLEELEARLDELAQQPIRRVK